MIKKKLGIDLTDRITMITSSRQIPKEFITPFLGRRDYDRLMNQWGPMYFINGKKTNYLAYLRSEEGWMVIHPEYLIVEPQTVIKDLGLDVLGLDMDQIMDLYINEENDLQEQIKRVIKEEMSIINRVKRRLNTIDLQVKYAMSKKVKREHFCNTYKNEDQFLEWTSHNLIEIMYYSYFTDIDNDTKEWDDAYNLIEKYIYENHGKELKNFYEKYCHGQTED